MNDKNNDKTLKKTQFQNLNQAINLINEHFDEQPASRNDVAEFVHDNMEITTKQAMLLGGFVEHLLTSPLEETPSETQIILPN